MSLSTQSTTATNVPSTAPANEGEKLQRVFDAVEACANGRATLAQVEDAVQDMLASTPKPPQPPDPPKERKRTRSNRVPQPLPPIVVSSSQPAPIQFDTDNYDNVGDAEGTLKLTGGSNKTGDKKKQASVIGLSEDDHYTHIPLGVAGARMLTTFGAGPKPTPETVETALVLARTCLLHALVQARQIRRRRLKEYRDAKLAMKPHVSKQQRSDLTMNQLPPELQYRVLENHDPTDRVPVGGFDLEDLGMVFPEQVNTYLKWNKSLADYTAQDRVVEPEVIVIDGSDDEDDEIQVVPEGHLLDRAAQLDVRTKLMDEDWYLEFAQIVRSKGSFVPSNRRNQGLQCARFLHWMGVWDPSTHAKQPHPVIIKAVAFLAFDFMGRIVEAAVRAKTIDLVTDLPEGESLTPDELRRAVEENPELKELSTLPEDGQFVPKAPQLYFGKGFEFRLEMEMEEMLSASKKRKDGVFSQSKIRADLEDAQNFAAIAKKAPSDLPTPQRQEAISSNNIKAEDGNNSNDKTEMSQKHGQSEQKKRGRPRKNSVSSTEQRQKKRGRQRKDSTQAVSMSFV